VEGSCDYGNEPLDSIKCWEGLAGQLATFLEGLICMNLVHSLFKTCTLLALGEINSFGVGILTSSRTVKPIMYIVTQKLVQISINVTFKMHLLCPWHDRGLYATKVQLHMTKNQRVAATNENNTSISTLRRNPKLHLLFCTPLQSKIMSFF
jgi:hypothetical protein